MATEQANTSLNNNAENGVVNTSEVVDELQDFPFHKAARAGNSYKVRKAVEADPSLLESRDNNGNTALHWAVGHLPVLRYLIAAGADAQATNNEGLKPIDYARLRQARLLLSGKAPQTAAAKEPSTPQKQTTPKKTTTTAQTNGAHTPAAQPSPAPKHEQKEQRRQTNRRTQQQQPIAETNTSTNTPATTTTTAAPVTPVTPVKTQNGAARVTNQNSATKGKGRNAVSSAVSSSASASIAVSGATVEETTVLNNLPDDMQLTVGVLKKLLADFKRQITMNVTNETKKLSQKFESQVSHSLRDNLTQNYGPVYSSSVELRNLNDIRNYINKIAQHHSFAIVEPDIVTTLAKRHLQSYLGYLANNIKGTSDNECKELYTFLIDHETNYNAEELQLQVQKQKGATRKALDAVLRAHITNDSETLHQVLFDALYWATHPRQMLGNVINVGVSGSIVTRQLSLKDNTASGIRLTITIGDVVPVLNTRNRDSTLQNLKHALNLVEQVFKIKHIHNIEKNAVVYYGFDETNALPASRTQLDASDSALQFSYVVL